MSATSTSQGGSESSSESASETSDTSNVGECGDHTEQSACVEDENCIWGITNNVTADAKSCDIEDGPGYCYAFSPDPGCSQGPTCSDDDREYYYRSTGAASWEVIPILGCPQFTPPEFSACQFDGSDPDVCDCLCDGGASAHLPDGWDENLSSAGCADMSVYAWNEDDTVGLSMFLSEGIVEAAADSQMTFEGTFDVAEFDRFVVLVGMGVTEPECNDAVVPGATEIDQEWVATAGSVHVVVVPEPDPPKFGTQGRATVTLSNVEVSYSGNTESIADLTFEDIAVGWLPG